MITGGVSIQVDTNVLRRTAGDVRRLVRLLRQDFDGLQYAVTRTRHYWIGDAGDRKREEFTERKTNVDDILTQFEEYPKDLLEMAKIYDDTVKENSSQMAALPSDFL